MTSTPTGSTETIAFSETPTLLNINMSNITKLTPTNYLMWSRQVHALLDGYDLAGYIDGSITAPSETINTAGTATTNTAYKFWKRQDS